MVAHMAHHTKRKKCAWSSSTAGGEFEDSLQCFVTLKPPQISAESLPVHLLQCWVQDQKLLPHPFHAASCILSTKASLQKLVVQHRVMPAWEELPSGFKTFL